jgi:hypothetical protein
MAAFKSSIGSSYVVRQGQHKFDYLHTDGYQEPGGLSMLQLEAFYDFVRKYTQLASHRKTPCDRAKSLITHGSFGVIQTCVSSC